MLFLRERKKSITFEHRIKEIEMHLKYLFNLLKSHHI